MDLFPLYILAGGQSSRFGANKALALLKSKPLVAHVVEQFAGVASGTTVIANNAVPYEGLGCAVIADIHAGLGPIGGLEAACRDMRVKGYFWLAGCDALLTKPMASNELLARADGHAKVIAFKGEFWEPLPGLYHSSILPAVEAQIAAGERAMWRLIERVEHRAVEMAAGVIAQINTPQDLERFAGRVPGEAGI